MKKMVACSLVALGGMLVGFAQGEDQTRPSPAPAIRVQGRHLVDGKGNCVRLMGVMQSIHPFFNHGYWGGGSDDAAAARALKYYDTLHTGLVDRKQGSYCNLIRLPDDGHWSNDDRLKPSKESPHFYACDWGCYTNYVANVLVPITENAVAHGLYVIIRPSYNNPGDTWPGCDFQRHLAKEWQVMASNKRLQALAGNVLFEIQNEPTTIFNPDKSRSEAAMAQFMQPLIDTIRQNGFKGIILVPGMGYQSWYVDYKSHPVKDPLSNMGFAVHVYPGWYGQRDETADVDRFVSNFLKQVPVVMDYPCVVTEVDWSPIKPGKGKTNEFGEWVSANWGSWGTGSTSKWGNAYIGVLERFGNISTIAGDAGIYLDIKKYLDTGKVEIFYGGEPECCAKAFFDLYKRWSSEKPQKPAVRDRNLPRMLEGEEIPLRTVKHLTSWLFRMTSNNRQLDIFGKDGAWDFQTRTIAEVGRAADHCHLFKAHERVVNGKTHYALKCYDNLGVLRLSGQDHGQGDSVCAASDWDGYIEGSSRAKNDSKWTTGRDYGTQRDYDGLWDIEAVDGGFTFKNVASGKYLGSVNGKKQSPDPVVWQCVTRAKRKGNGDRGMGNGDRGMGTGDRGMAVRNPAIYADCPDVGLCSDGKYCYMVSTTMHMMPGAPVMRSKDMVHWETVSYVFDRFEFGPEFSFDDPRDATAYAGGQWASSIRYHDGKFYCYFIANGHGGFMYTADKAEGPWKLLCREPFMHDASLLFDDDGKTWVFHGNGWLTLMKDDLTGIAPGWENIRLFELGDEKGLLEGSSVFKKDGWYYLMMVSDFMEGHIRREVCYRSRNVKGPYEKKVILETEFDRHGGVGQGAVVQCPDGSWKALVFQNRGGVGRTPCLMPVRWVDDWPMLGDESGHIPDDKTKLYPDLSGVIGSDGFDAPKLDKRWQWNHNPDDASWSLSERKGWLRLKTGSVAKNIFIAKNTLTQRMAGPESTATVRLDVSKMKDGDHAGLAAFQGDSAVAEVVMENGIRSVVLSRQSVEFRNDNGRFFDKLEQEEFLSAPFKGDTVWFRVRGNFRQWQDWAESAWSEDGKTWHWTGKHVPMRFNVGKFFMGARFAIFNYATKSAGGYVDVDKFVVEMEEHELPVARFRKFTLDADGAKFEDDFVNPILDAAWKQVAPTNTFLSRSAVSKGRGLALEARQEPIDGSGVPAFLYREADGKPFSVSTAVMFRPRSACDLAGLAVSNPEREGFAFGITCDASGKPAVSLVRTEGGVRTEVASVTMMKIAPLFLKVERRNSTIRFVFSLDGKKWQAVGGAENAAFLDDMTSVGLYATSQNL